tara:strand:+ start:1164 stop:1271 length:108 start_codon:yes stop_codon:yes gene_type:complete
VVVITRNFGAHEATPLEDVIVAILLSFLEQVLKNT